MSHPFISESELRQFIQFVAAELRCSSISLNTQSCTEQPLRSSAAPKLSGIEHQTTRYLRLKQIIGDPKADPPISPILPISKSSWYAGIKSGRYPAGISISPRTTIWRADEELAIVTRKAMGGSHE